MFCSRCGAQFQGQPSFCSACGAAVNEASAPKEQAALRTEVPKSSTPGKATDFWGWTWKDTLIRLGVLGGICAAGNAYYFHANNPNESVAYAVAVGGLGALVFFLFFGAIVALIRKIMPTTRALPVARSFGIAIGVTFIINFVSAGCALMIR